MRGYSQPAYGGSMARTKVKRGGKLEDRKDTNSAIHSPPAVGGGADFGIPSSPSSMGVWGGHHFTVTDRRSWDCNFMIYLREILLTSRIGMAAILGVDA